MSTIDCTIDAQVAVITLSDSLQGNRLNLPMLESLSSALSQSTADAQVRVIVLRSSGEAFCLGMDLLELQRRGGQGLERALSLYVDLLAAIYNSRKPVICLVNGPVKAGGVGLMAACDIVLATERASVELSEVLFGMIPANVLPYLLGLRLHAQKARYLILSSKCLNAREALQLNLIDELFPDDSFEKSVRHVIKRLFRSSPGALAEAKAFTRDLQGRDLQDACAMARKKLLELVQNPEVLAGVSAFNEGALPEWFGKYRPEKSVTGT